MSAAIYKWTRVSRAEPCPHCEKPDWCTVCSKGRCCMRSDSGRPMANGGFWFPFDAPELAREAVRVRPTPKPEAPAPDFGSMMNQWRETSDPNEWQAMAENLGIEWKALWWLAPMWARDRSAMAFPMHESIDADEDKPCGIRLRTMEGKKFAVTGSKSGLFVPHRAIRATVDKFNMHRLFICEGPTDTAACLQMGFLAIGRASCRGGEDAVVNAINRLASEAVIVSDNDGPGAEGADVLAAKIRKPIYRLCTPSKDLRAFIRDGGNAAIIEAMLKNLIRK